MVRDIISNHSVIDTQNIIEINFSAANNSEEFAVILAQIKDGINKALNTTELSKEDAEDARKQVDKAISQANSSQPDAAKLTRYLRSAQSLVGGIAGLVKSCDNAIDAISKLFQ